MSVGLDAIVRDVERKRKALKAISKVMLIPTKEDTEKDKQYSKIFSSYALWMENILDDIEVLYKAMYYHNQDLGLLAKTILELPELQKDRVLWRKIFNEFRKAGKRT
jgi:hypothetical protein